MRLSKEGSALYVQRQLDVKLVFGQIKVGLGVTRFNLRSKSEVKTAVDLALKANNLMKYAKVKAIK